MKRAIFRGKSSRVEKWNPDFFQHDNDFSNRFGRGSFFLQNINGSRNTILLKKFNSITREATNRELIKKQLVFTLFIYRVLTNAFKVQVRQHLKNEFVELFSGHVFDKI